MVCDPSTPYVIYSGSDEQVIRVLEGVQSVVDGIATICVDPISNKSLATTAVAAVAVVGDEGDAATVPQTSTNTMK